MGPSTLASWALLIHRTLSARGIDGDALFRRAGLEPTHLNDPNGRYPQSGMQKLWALATAATGDPCFGLEVAQAWHPTTFHALGYSALASETLREALQRVARYSRVVTTGARIELTEEGGEVMVKFAGTPSPEQLVPASVDAGTASIAILCREARGERIDPVRVKYGHADSACSERLEAFFGCKVEFGTTENGIAFRSADLDDHLPTANPVLLRVNDQLLTEYMAHLDRSEIPLQVQAKLVQTLPAGAMTETAMARALNLSQRSLQRKLSERGTTFRQVVDETRKQLAEQYLKDSMLSVSEIAYLLGFAEVSSFSRAFRRWTGQAPRGATGKAHAEAQGGKA
jgi:AraC-like DNA-binding protein